MSPTETSCSYQSPTVPTVLLIGISQTFGLGSGNRMDTFDYLSAVTDHVIAVKWGLDSAPRLAAATRIREVDKEVGNFLVTHGFKSSFDAGQLPRSEHLALAKALRSCEAVVHITDPGSFPFVHAACMKDLAAVMQRLVELGWGDKRARCCVAKLKEAINDAEGELIGTPATSITLPHARLVPHAARYMAAMCLDAWAVAWMHGHTFSSCHAYPAPSFVF